LFLGLFLIVFLLRFIYGKELNKNKTPQGSSLENKTKRSIAKKEKK
jgi:hypothetical protein